MVKVNECSLITLDVIRELNKKISTDYATDDVNRMPLMPVVDGWAFIHGTCNGFWATYPAEIPVPDEVLVPEDLYNLHDAEYGWAKDYKQAPVYRSIQLGSYIDITEMIVQNESIKHLYTPVVKINFDDKVTLPNT